MHGTGTPSWLARAAHTTVHAYARGVFPMADDSGIHWHAPLHRAVLPLERLHVPRRLARSMRGDSVQIRYDTAFADVLDACAAPAPDRPETWIDPWIRQIFIELHRLGVAHSAEAWHDGRLVGGLYGIALGGFFAGESMFHRRRDASKMVLAQLAQDLHRFGFTLFDVQYKTPHLAQFGVEEVTRPHYQRLLAQALGRRPGTAPWLSPSRN